MQSSTDSSAFAKHNMSIGISSCLLGEKVRYDAGHKLHSYITETLGKYFSFKAFCPEIAIGLGAPRETIKLVQIEDRVHCIGTKTPSLDVTLPLVNAADEQGPIHKSLCGYIFKKGSPSCGPAGVKLFGLNPEKPEQYLLEGTGIFAKRLTENIPHLPVEDEERIGDPLYRENFIERVFAYRRWLYLQEEGLDRAAIIEFHQAYKYVLMSHDIEETSLLCEYLASTKFEAIDAVSDEYYSAFTRIMKVIATRESHITVLEQLKSQLPKEVGLAAAHELNGVFQSYLTGQVPRLVPVTILKHYLARLPEAQSSSCHYLFPHHVVMSFQN